MCICGITQFTLVALDIAAMNADASALKTKQREHNTRIPHVFCILFYRFDAYTVYNV